MTILMLEAAILAWVVIEHLRCILDALIAHGSARREWKGTHDD